MATQTESEKTLREEDAASIKDWIDEIGGHGAVKVNITRMRPQEFNGRPVGGSLETVEEPIDEEYIRDTWGGGHFQLKVSILDEKGKWKYFRARSIRLAGDPKEHGAAIPPPGMVGPAMPETDDLAQQAMSVMEPNMERAYERADRAESGRGNGGMDWEAIRLINDPLHRQLEAYQQTIRDLQTKILERDDGSKTDPFRDKLLEKMVDGEKQRVDTLREQHASELRQMRQSHQDEIKSIRDQHREDLKQLTRQHEREVQLIERSYEGQVKANDVAYATRSDGLKSEVDRLNRELTAAQAEIATLRAKKDQSLPEKAEELMTVRDAITGLVGADSDDTDKDKPGWQRFGEMVLGSDMAKSVGQRLMGAVEAGAPAPGQPQPMPQQLPVPPGVPFQGPDGGVYVLQPDGTPVQVDAAAAQQRRIAAARARRRQQQAQQPGAQQPGAQPESAEAAPPPGPPPRPIPQVDPAEVAIAINFMENAVRNGTSPEEFAKTARNLVPTDILEFIAAVGVDDFLNQVAHLEPGSPLTTQNGRNFARGVAKYLLEGTAELE